MAKLTDEQIAQRNTNLDNLKTAVIQWANQEEQRITNESLFIRSVLQARGADVTGVLNLLAGASELGDEIDRFLLLGPG